MSFLFYWMSRGTERYIRIDAEDELEARDSFKRAYPRRKVTRVENVTTFVKSGIGCY